MQFFIGFRIDESREIKILHKFVVDNCQSDAKFFAHQVNNSKPIDFRFGSFYSTLFSESVRCEFRMTQACLFPRDPTHCSANRLSVDGS